MRSTIARMSYTYSYSQSQMRPPFWIVKRDMEHIAECWNENDARLIVRALEVERSKKGSTDRRIDELCIGTS